MNNKVNPAVFVIFGGSGDLTWRKLIPALYNLYLDDMLNEQNKILCIGLTKMSNEEYIKHLKEGVDKFSRRGKVKAPQWGFILKYFIDKGQLDELPQYIMKKRFPAYDLLMIPTSSRLQVFKHFHKPENKYITAKYNLLDDVLLEKNISTSPSLLKSPMPAPAPLYKYS